MLMIRLQPTGRTGSITYRVVVSERRSKLIGHMIDDLGYYNAVAKPAVVSIDSEKLKYWESKGAQVSSAVKKLLASK